MNESITTHEQWLAARKNGIGASECSAIVGMNPYMSSVELWKLKTGRKEAADISSKPHVAYGHAAEAPLRELFALDYADRFEVGYGGEFDVVVALYHDQALAPLKTLEFDEAVNISLGLPRVRTSPDHGTAYDIAGKGVAQCRSFANAVRVARRLI